MTKKRNKPNLILLVMDTQRADNMSCYGYDKPTTPNIDKIACGGVTFTANISPGAWSLSGYASMMTGMYPSSHGADLQHERLEKRYITVPRALSKLGYHTAGFSTNAWCVTAAGLHRGFSEFHDTEEVAGWRNRPEVSEALKERGEEFDEGSLSLVFKLLEWLDARRETEAPFFLFANFGEPHSHYWPCNPYRRRFLPGDVTDGEARGISQDSYAEMMGQISRSERDWQILRGLYDGETASLDARLGILFDYLLETGLLDNTILIITSDHGDEIGEHPPLIHHGWCLYDSIIRVPLIVRFPPIFPPGRKVEPITQTLDIFPTLVEILSVKDDELLRQLQGRSLLNAVRGENQREFAVAERSKHLQGFERIWRRFPEADLRPWNYWLKAIRTRKHKYIWRSDGKDELYGLEADPDEQHNISNEDPQLVCRMKKMLGDWLARIPQAALDDYLNLGASAGVSADRDALRRLKQWGFYHLPI